MRTLEGQPYPAGDRPRRRRGHAQNTCHSFCLTIPRQLDPNRIRLLPIRFERVARVSRHQWQGRLAFGTLRLSKSVLPGVPERTHASTRRGGRTAQWQTGPTCGRLHRRNARSWRSNWRHCRRRRFELVCLLGCLLRRPNRHQSSLGVFCDVNRSAAKYQDSSRSIRTQGPNMIRSPVAESPGSPPGTMGGRTADHQQYQKRPEGRAS